MARAMMQLAVCAVIAVMSTGCEPSSSTVVSPELARIHAQLGLRPPFRLQSVESFTDGGTYEVTVIGARAKVLKIYSDNRMNVDVVPDRPSGHPPRQTWLDHYPEQEGSRRLEFGSPAESAVVDLLHLQVRQMITAGEESALVEAGRKAQSADSWSVWFNGLSKGQRTAYWLRNVLQQIEGRREAALHAPESARSEP